jgi:hypothetical protein
VVEVNGLCGLPGDRDRGETRRNERCDGCDQKQVPMKQPSSAIHTQPPWEAVIIRAGARILHKTQLLWLKNVALGA